MISGALTDIIVIEKPSIVKDAYGATTTIWEDYITTRTNPIFNSGNKTEDNHELFHSIYKTFEIRVYHEVSETMRCRHNGKRYQILSIEKDKKRQKLILTTELINE